MSQAQRRDIEFHTDKYKVNSVVSFSYHISGVEQMTLKCQILEEP